MYILRTVAANIDDEIIDMNHNAIQNFLAKEHEIQELAAELALERDTLGKDLQRACDAELKQVEDKVESSDDDVTHANIMTVPYYALIS
ncbi:hypothetical protein FPRO06_13863 [Fusarium proliferatum]|nr:hypothetical protein FPRO06_13863 [Fusarium proliferatum]